MELLIALKEIPGSIQIAPGQSFYELNNDQREQLIRSGHARLAHPQQDTKPPTTTSLVQVSTNARELAMVDGFPDWRGATAVIIASGPSLTQDQCLHVEMWRMTPAVERRVVIAINTSWQMAPFADMLYACDGAWWRAKEKPGEATNYERVAANFHKSQLWTQDVNAAREFGLQLIRSQNKPGLSRRRDVIYQGANGAYQAMNLAFFAGVKRFVLLGVDCKGGHWHGNHPSPLSNSLPHKMWMDRFAGLASDLRDEGIPVVNCSPGTALRAFPTGDIERELLL